MITLDKIKKQVLLDPPLDRVWNGITDTQQFGRWFSVHLNGQFADGKIMTGTFHPAHQISPYSNPTPQPPRP